MYVNLFGLKNWRAFLSQKSIEKNPHITTICVDLFRWSIPFLKFESSYNKRKLHWLHEIYVDSLLRARRLRHALFLYNENTEISIGQCELEVVVSFYLFICCVCLYGCTWEYAEWARVRKGLLLFTTLT